MHDQPAVKDTPVYKKGRDEEMISVLFQEDALLLRILDLGSWILDLGSWILDLGDDPAGAVPRHAEGEHFSSESC
jgi:hypothetical protein